MQANCGIVLRFIEPACPHAGRRRNRHEDTPAQLCQKLIRTYGDSAAWFGRLKNATFRGYARDKHGVERKFGASSEGSILDPVGLGWVEFWRMDRFSGRCVLLLPNFHPRRRTVLSEVVCPQS